MLRWALAACLLAGCARPLEGFPDDPECVTLYSIDPRPFEIGEVRPYSELFRGYAVLGKVEITDQQKRQQIIAAVNRGLAQGKHLGGAACFRPRHGVRATSNGRIIDCLICFECRNVDLYEGDRRYPRGTNREPQPLLNQLLQEVHVPLAPGALDEEK
jgi:hypothetical protein